MSEMVNHPSHYQQAGRKECIVEMLENYGAETTVIFCLTNAYKYLYRAGEKADNSYEQDVRKATWYYNYANGLLEKYKGIWAIRLSSLYKDIMNKLIELGV